MAGHSECAKIKEERFEFKVPSNIKYIKEVWSKILSRISRLHMSDADIFDLRLSTEESIVNAIKYGNKFKEDLPVEIEVVISNNCVQISIEDRGEGFDHVNLPDPTVNNNIGKASGRGLYLIMHLMDKVTFNEKGNRITMIKYIKR